MAIAAAASVALSFGGFGKAFAVNNHPDEASEAAASVLAASLMKSPLAGAGTTEASFDADQGPNDEALNVDLLGNQVLNLGNGISIPVTDLIDFGKIGALGSESEASSATDAHAVSGLVAEGGSVTLSGDDADFGAATVDLLSLADKAGVDGITDAAIDQLELQLGAGGAEVTAEDGKILDPDGVGGGGQYRVAQADLLVGSPAVKDAANGIYSAVGTVDTNIEQMVNDNLDLSALTGLLDAVPGVPTPTVTVDSNTQDAIFERVLAKPITSSNKLITIDFSTGEMQIHLDQALKGGLNAQDPNTELLTSQLYPLIAETVHDIMRDITNLIVGEIADSLDAVTINLQFTDDYGPGGKLDVLWPVNLQDAIDGNFPKVQNNSTGPVGSTTGATLAGVINGLGGAAAPVFAPVYDFILSDAGNKIFDLAINDIKLGITTSIVNAIKPVFDVLNEFISLQLNHQDAAVCTPTGGGDDVPAGLDVSALSLGVLPSQDGGRLNFGNAGVRITPDVCPLPNAEGAPEPANDTAETDQGKPVTVDVLANDDPGDSDLDPTTVLLTPPDGGDPAKSITTDAGKWDVDPDTGEVTFTPNDDFLGKADPITYTVANENGKTGSGTLTVTVNEPAEEGAPAPVDDTAETEQGKPVTVDVLANDDPGDSDIDPTSVVLTPTDGGDPAKSITTDEGKWVVDPASGEVTFTPGDDYTGTTAPVTYTVSNANDKTGTGTVTVTVNEPAEQGAPAPVDDSGVTEQGKPVTIDPLANDDQGDSPLDPGSVVLTPADGGDPAKSVTTDEGNWVVDPDSGEVTFTPADDYTGTTPAITYTVSNENDKTGSAKITVTVTPASQDGAPTAADDTAETEQGKPVTIDPLANDLPGDSDLDPASVVLNPADGGDPAKSITTDDGKYVVDPKTGEVTFTPNDDFIGKTAPVPYTVANENGKTATALITVTVTEPSQAGAPAPVDDTAETEKGKPVTVDVLANDDPGDSPLDPSSVVLTGPNGGDPAQEISTPAGDWKVDPKTGEVTFTPKDGFTGPAGPVTYTVTNENGKTGQGQVNVVVNEPAEDGAPTATDDKGETEQGKPVTLDILANDQGGDSDLDPTSVTLLSPNGDTGKGASTDEGSWLADPKTGTVTFTPSADFVGDTAPLPYTVANENGKTDTALITVTVSEPAGAGSPKAIDDLVITPKDTPVTVDVLDNDQPGDSPLDPTSVVLTGPGGGDPAKEIKTPAGDWKVDPKTGEVTFTPKDGFTGPAGPITYTVSNENGKTDSATLTAVVTEPAPSGSPTAADDAGVTEKGKPLTLDVLANDKPGDSPLDPSSVVLTDPDGTTAPTVTTDEGTWAADPKTGKVTFTPKDDFTGEAAPVAYTVSNENGKTGSALITATVMDPSAGDGSPTAADDQGVTEKATPILLDVLANDKAGDSPLDPASVKLTGSDGKTGTSVTTDEGSWKVNTSKGDNQGKVTFTPKADYLGKTAKVPYSVAGENGKTGAANLSVIVIDSSTTDGSPKPVDDVLLTEQGKPVTVDVLANDDGGSSPLDPTSVVLTGPDGTTGKTITTNGGTWSVDPKTGDVTFTPDPDFIGTAGPVTYTVTNQDGLTGSAQLTSVVSEAAQSGAPTAADDSAVTEKDMPITVDVLANDDPGDSALDPSTVRLHAPNGDLVSKIKSDVGTWKVDPENGKVTFTPADGLVGNVAPVAYTVANKNGKTGSALITVTVIDSGAGDGSPTAADDAAVTRQAKPVTIDVLANDDPGDSDLDPSSVKLSAGDGKGVGQLDGDAGSWAIDQETGAVTFTPAKNFIGDVDPVVYTVSNENGKTGSATISVTVVEAAENGAPSVVDDSVKTPQCKAITIDVLANDKAGDSPIDPATVILKSAGAQQVTGANQDVAAAQAGKTISGAEGNWMINKKTGKVTYTPDCDFVGSAEVSYSVSGENGKTGSATVTVTVVKADGNGGNGNGPGGNGAGDGNHGGLASTGSTSIMLAGLILGLLSLLSGGIITARRLRTRR